MARGGVVNLNRRLERCEQRVPLLRIGPDASPTDRAIAAVAANRWDWSHLETLSGGKTQLRQIRRELFAAARLVRARRAAGEPVVLGDPYSLGALILSYKPHEAVPPLPARLLEVHLKRLGGTRPGELEFVYGLAAGEVKLILKAPDAVYLRSQLWRVDQA